MDHDPEKLEARFIDLEIRLSYQEDSLQKLEAALRDKDRELRKLQRDFQTLQDFLHQQLSS